VKAKAAADAIFAANTVATQSKLSWPVIMNASLFVVDRNYIDGWVIKGTDIVTSAIFEGRPDSHSIHLIDARGSTVPCTAQQRTSYGTLSCCMMPHQHSTRTASATLCVTCFTDTPHLWTNVVCSFASLQDMDERMQWGSRAPNISALPTYCRCCSVAATIAMSLNSKIVYLPPLRHFPKASTAIVLATIFGDPPANVLANWMAHNTYVLGVGLIIVYSQTEAATFDRIGVLRPFYEFNSGRGVVIVNVPEIEALAMHYYNQHYVINNALLRSMGAIDYLGSFDGDEYLDIPLGYNMTTYLRTALQCHVSPADASICTGHKFAAVGLGSLMVSGYYTGFNFDKKMQFCINGSIDDYSYLPSQAECNGDQTPEVSASEPVQLAGQLRI
jgi:hypothetical protein